MNDEQHHDIGERRPQYPTDERQKCFIAYSEQAYWSADLLGGCEQVLSQPKFNLEPDYARKHFVSDVHLDQKALELIKHARYGIYDLSCWRGDDQSPWQMPRNVFIELGMAIALNRPTLLLRHTNSKEADLKLPNCLKFLGKQILEFSGKGSLEKVLLKNLPELPDKVWPVRDCIFGRRVCEYRETHPWAKQFRQNTLNCIIADGEDSSRPDFREIVKDVLGRYSDVTYTYLDDLSLEKGYSFLLCTHCQKIRSSPLAIHRITLKTPPEAFIAIGMSLALETQFEYKIPKILITEDLQIVPSLLLGYKVVIARSDKEKKDSLLQFMPTVIKKVRIYPENMNYLNAQINSYRERLEKLLDANWLEPEKILVSSGRRGRANVNQLSKEEQSSTPFIQLKRGKKIELDNQIFALIIEITQEEKESKEMKLSFQLRPCGEYTTSLPSGLELALLNPSREVIISITAKTGDNQIFLPPNPSKPATIKLEKLESNRKAGKLFQVQITLKGESKTEPFPSIQPAGSLNYRL